MYTHTKTYGIDIIPQEEITSERFISSSISFPPLTAVHLGEHIEGLKHFAVSDVKFHPQR